MTSGWGEKESARTEGQVVPRLSLLSEEQVNTIREMALKILTEIGVAVENDEVFRMLADVLGVKANSHSRVVQFSPDLVLERVARTPKFYTLFGRDATRHVTYGRGQMIFKSTPGDPLWADAESKTLREPSISDTRQAIDVADALPNFDVVGAMAHPAEIPEPVRAIHLVAELVKRTRKPVRVWVPDRSSAHYIVEILKVVAGGAEQLRRTPITEHSLEPISPLRFATGLEATLEFTVAGLPIVIGPIVQAMATGPATLAGTIAQTIAEGLAGLVIIQCIRPGHPLALAAACHHADPRTMNIVYGSPEQGLLMAATTQVIKSFGLPVFANAGYTDAKVPDAQAGLEKGMTLLMAALAGADSFAPMGVSGTVGASLLQLVIDDEMIGHLRRTMRGFEVTPETLAFEVIKGVGIGGNFLTEEHTLRHLRDEFWVPALSDRETHTTWTAKGGKTMLDRAAERRDEILQRHKPDWLEENMQKEIDRIVAVAERELLG
jgi:trimethylamine--corrinoid protein Co-methyltransferase